MISKHLIYGKSIQRQQLYTAVIIISFKDNDEEFVMHSKSDNIEIMINDKAY